MRSYVRFLPPAAVAAVLFVAPVLVPARSAGAAPPSTAQDVSIVGPLTSNGSVPVEATIKGIVKTRVNPALTHVGALASDIVTLVADGSDITEVRSDGSTSSSTTYFTVPSGRALVLTDVQWSGYGTPGAGKQFEVQLFPGSSFVRVFALIDAFDANGFLTRAHNMTTGIAVGPGVRIRFDVSSETTAYVHGYYVDTP